MSTFSSVIRKPGQKIKPKIAPRRHVQRNAQKPLTPTSTLTPESTHDDPARATSHEQVEESVAHSGPNTETTSTIPNPSGEDASSTLTPASTIPTRVSPLPSLQNDHLTDMTRQSLIDSRQLSVQRSVSRERPSGVPPVTTSDSVTHAGVKRKAHEISDSQSPHRVIENGQQVGEIEVQRASSVASSPRDPSIVVDLSQTDSSLQISTEHALETRRSISRRRDDISLTPEVLIQQATSQAAVVSELANAITNRTRTLRPRPRQDSSNVADRVDDDDNTAQLDQSLRRRKNQTRSTAIEKAASAVIDKAVHRGVQRHRRGQTPEDAEEHEIDPTSITMGDLTRDTGLGKRSLLGNRIDAEWSEIKDRWDKKATTNRQAAKEKGKKQKRTWLAGNAEEELSEILDEIPQPQPTIVNGMIVLPPESREIAFSSNLERAAVQHEVGALEDERIYRYVNSSRIGKNAGLRRGTRWDDDLTNLFYQGLRMFGTDFMMISNMFPDMDRKQIKQKYVREERLNLARVRENLAQQQRVDLEEYAKMTDMEFQDPKTIAQEIEAEEKRLREEDEKRRQQEGFIQDEADTVLPSTEVDDNGEPGARETIPPDNETAAQRAASRVIQDIGLPSAPKRRQRKPKDPSKTRTIKKGRKPLEGVEERIGPIDEVGV